MLIYRKKHSKYYAAEFEMIYSISMIDLVTISVIIVCYDNNRDHVV